MAIPESVASAELIKAARRCCICRRFRPLHLHIHHIIEEADGGTNDPDNLIPICISCHADVHTKTQLCRRFTHQELKGQRDALYRLVEQGRLPQAEGPPDRWEELSSAIVSTLVDKMPPPQGIQEQLTPEAIEILLAAAKKQVPVHAHTEHFRYCVRVGSRIFGKDGDMRQSAQYRHAIQCLINTGLLEEQGNWFSVSYRGYLLADDLLAAQSEAT